MVAIASTQVGSAIAKSLFDVLSPMGIVFLRVGFAAIMLMLVCRPPIRVGLRANPIALTAFGLALALMNLSFYLASERIPLGIAVTVEFIGPLGVAIAHSRRWLDGLWVVLAGVGILLLAPIGNATFDPVGIALAALAGAFWASYILLSARVGRIAAGGSGLALAMTLGAIALLPVGLIGGGRALLQPKLLLLGFGVAMLSSALPYSLELIALRSMPLRVFGVLMSLEPATAALVGFLMLGETLEPQAMMAIVLVSAAAAGSSRFATLGPANPTKDE